MPVSFATRPQLGRALVVLGGLALAGGCAQKVAPDMPPSLSFVVLDKQGNNLLTSITTPIKVSFINSSGQQVYEGAECAGGSCTMVRQAYSRTGPAKYSFCYQSLDMSWVSANGIKTYYIDLDGKVDTLFYDVQKSEIKAVNLMASRLPSTRTSYRFIRYKGGISKGWLQQAR